MKEKLVWRGEIPEEYRQRFEDEGFLYIKDFYSRENEINEIKKDIYNLIGPNQIVYVFLYFIYFILSAVKIFYVEKTLVFESLPIFFRNFSTPD